MAGRDKRQAIMKAAERLFTTRRFHEITLDDVTRLARIGKGTIYRHFRDKDDLFFQTVTNGFDELCDLLRREVPAGAGFAGQLTEACVQISRFFERRRPLMRMMQTEEGRMILSGGSLRQRWMERRRGLVAAVSDVIEKGVREGHVRSDVPADVLASYLLGLLRTRARDLAEAAPRHQRVELTVDLFLGGVARSKPTRRGRQGQT